jgi:YHS domain-containing protein
MSKNTFYAILLLLFVVSFSSNSDAQDKSKKETKTEVKKDSKTSSKPFNTVCPVTGEDLDDSITYVYKEKTYSLCCKRCLAKFQKDPEKYIKNLSEDGTKFIKK